MTDPQLRQEVATAVGRHLRANPPGDSNVDDVEARKLSAYCKAKRLLSEEQCGFRPDRSTTDMMFVVRRLQEIGRKAGVYLFMCFIDLPEAYDTVDRTLLW